MGDLVAQWKVPLADKVHVIEFEHGTTTGKRIIRVDKKTIKQEDWMFKLVGREHFNVGTAKCTITIEAVSGFAYEYSLEVNGKSLQKFSDNQSKIMRSWALVVDGVKTRVVLEKDKLDVWVNGQKLETTAEFVDDGVETHFVINHSHSAFIKAVSSGKRKTGIVHKLFVDETEIPESHE